MPSRPPQNPAPTDAPPLSRRSLVQAAGAWAATAGWQGAQAQTPETLHSRVVDLRGDVLRNGTRLSAQDRIAAGDQLETAQPLVHRYDTVPVSLRTDAVEGLA